MPCEAAGCGGEIDGLHRSVPIEGRVSQRSEILGGVTSEDRAAVLIERGLAHLRHAVFDGSPVIADEREPLRRIRSTARERGDVVGRLDLAFAVLGSLAHHTTDLLHAGPIAVVVQRGRGGDGSLLKATVALVQRAGGLLFGSALANGVRGPVFERRKTGPQARQ